MKRAALALLATALLAAAGCSRTRLEIEPAIVPSCKPGYSEVIDVRWDASRNTTGRVSIEVLRPGTAAKPWIKGDPIGHRKTGRWGNDGLTFVLRDDGGRELARRTVETVPCPGAKD